MSYRHINIWYKIILGDNMVLGDFGTLDKCYDVFFMPILSFMVVMFSSLILLFSKSF